MTATRLALVADDARLASAIQAHLNKAFGQAVFQCDLDAVRHHLTRETDGLLLLATASAAEARARSAAGAGDLPAEAAARHHDRRRRRRGRRPAWPASSPTSPSRLRWPDDAAAPRRSWSASASAGVRDLPSAAARDRRGGHPPPPAGARRRRCCRWSSASPWPPRHDVTVLLTGETGTGKTLPGPADARLLAAQGSSRS